MKKWLILTGIILGAIAGWAQPKKWTVEECIDYGVEQSLQMQRQQLENRNERLGVRDAALDLIPSLNAISPNVSYNYGRGIDPTTNTYTNVENRTVGGLGVGGGVTLFSGFSGINRLRYAKIARLRGLEMTENMANNLAIDIMNAFISLVSAEESIRITTELLENSALQLKKIQREYELGRRPKSDLFDMQAQYASNEYQLSTCHNNRANAMITLTHLMNYQEDEELVIDLSSLADIIPVHEQTDVNTIYNKALDELPEALMASYNVRLNKLNLATTRASLYPTLSMSGNISFGYYSNHSDGSFWSQVSDKNRIGKSFGFSLNVPVFYGLQRRSNVTRAKNNYRSQQIQYEQTQQKIYNEIRKAVLDLESGIQQFELAKKKEQFSVLSYNAGKKRYEQGLCSIIDLNTVSNNVLQAKFDLLRARLDYVMQKKMVDFYKGQPLQTRVH